MFLSIPPIKSNKEVLLASDMVRVKISSCVDEQKAVCELLTLVQGVSRSLSGPRASDGFVQRAEFNSRAGGEKTVPVRYLELASFHKYRRQCCHTLRSSAGFARLKPMLSVK